MIEKIEDDVAEDGVTSEAQLQKFENSAQMTNSTNTSICNSCTSASRKNNNNKNNLGTEAVTDKETNPFTTNDDGSKQKVAEIEAEEERKVNTRIAVALVDIKARGIT